MYRIIGADQREYGPVSPDEVREWITSHRADRDTRILAEGTVQWKRLGEFPEFADALQQAEQPPAPSRASVMAPSSPAAGTRTNGLAITSLVLGVLGLVSCGITALVGLVLGIIALVRINKSGGQQRGQGLAIAGIVVSGIFLLALPIGAALLLPALAQSKTKAHTVMCVNNLRQLALGALMYADDESGKLPPADRWCEAVKKYVGSEAPFHCASGAPQARCHYGYNARLAGAELKRITSPAAVVLFFEVEGGWNLSGGPEAMMPKPRHSRGVGVAFLDGHTEIVTESRMRQLKWEPQ